MNQPRIGVVASRELLSARLSSTLKALSLKKKSKTRKRCSKMAVLRMKTCRKKAKKVPSKAVTKRKINLSLTRKLRPWSRKVFEAPEPKPLCLSRRSNNRPHLSRKLCLKRRASSQDAEVEAKL